MLGGGDPAPRAFQLAFVLDKTYQMAEHWPSLSQWCLALLNATSPEAKRHEYGLVLVDAPPPFSDWMCSASCFSGDRKLVMQWLQSVQSAEMPAGPACLHGGLLYAIRSNTGFELS